MNKSPKQIAKRVERIMARPTQYVFDLTDVDMKCYTEVLNVLFNEPAFKADVEKRNRFVRSAGSMRPHSSELDNIVRVIQQHDRKLADQLFTALVQANLHAQFTLEKFSLEDMLRNHVDYSKPGVIARVDQLKLNLDRLIFLSDMLDGVLLDVKVDLEHVTDGQIEYKQFDAVRDAMSLIKVFFGQVRDGSDSSSPESQLFTEYADSINDYLTKRLKTYSEKLRRIRESSVPSSSAGAAAAPVPSSEVAPRSQSAAPPSATVPDGSPSGNP